VSIVSAANTLVDDKSSFDAAVSNASPGDTIKLKNGTWTNTTLGFYANGTEENPIIVTAETAGEVVLKGSSRIEIYGKYLEVHNLDFKDGALSSGHVVEFRKGSSELAENCRLTNCRILNYNPSSDETEYKWVSVFGKNNRVDHCTFSGKNHEGALLVVWLNGSANNHRIDHNYFSDIPRLDRNGAETIRIGTSTNSMTVSRTIVEHNVFEKCDGELEIISNKSNFNIYRYNTFINNDGGLTLRHGNDCDVYGNFFFGAAGKSCGGVRIIGERHKVYNNYFQDLEGQGTRSAISMMNGVPNSPLNRYFQVKNGEVVHNTIVNCRQAFAFGVGNNDELSLPPLDCIIANNVVDEDVKSDAIRYYDTPINVSYTDNYINSGSLEITDLGIKNIDSELSLTDGMWRVVQGPTIDATTMTFDYVTQDVDGQGRDQAPDIGSDEISQDDVAISPLSANEVGANWNKGVVSVNTFTTFEANVFVNAKRLTISGLASNYVYSVIIYNTAGQEIFTKDIFETKENISLPHLTGFYIVQIKGSENAVYRKKVWF
jgi:poly(beta-D-mannuronate) lyase